MGPSPLKRVSGNVGELRQTVNLFPSGLECSNHSLPLEHCALSPF
ncbi:hypothetical protein IM043_gp246 [Bacillus phage SPG24]|nr:hypothetical protein IM043_gp246 [Bacillus phage SPG24]